MKTSLPTPMTARVYVNLPEGNIHSEFLSTFHLAIDGHRYFVEMFGAGAFLVTGRLKADCSSARNLAHLQAACVAAVGLAGRRCEFAPQGVENPSIPLGRPVWCGDGCKTMPFLPAMTGNGLYIPHYIYIYINWWWWLGDGLWHCFTHIIPQTGKCLMGKMRINEILGYLFSRKTAWIGLYNKWPFIDDIWWDFLVG